MLSVLWLSAGLAINKVIMNNSHLWMVKLKFMIANVTCAGGQLTFLKCFAEWTHWDLTTFKKIASSQYSEITLVSWRLQPWATRLFVQQIIKTNNKANTKAPHHLVLWEPSVTGGFSLQMGQWCGNRHWYYDSYSAHYGAIWRHKSVNTDSGNGLLPDGTKPLPGPVLTYHR